MGETSQSFKSGKPGRGPEAHEVLVRSEECWQREVHPKDPKGGRSFQFKKKQQTNKNKAGLERNQQKLYRKRKNMWG